MIHRFSVLILMLLLAACSSILQKPEPPQVALAGITLTEANLFEQRFLLKLRVSNPNGFDLPIKGLRYQLDLADREFMRGQSATAVTIPRFGNAHVEVEAHTNLLELMRQIRSLSESDRLRYRLRGELTAGEANFTLPFDRSGEYDFSALDRMLPR